MKLYFVRHGQTDWNVQRLTQGWTDIPLNDTGIKQAEILRSKLAQSGLKFDAVYSSPLQRAAQTAEIATAGIAAKTAATNESPIIYDNRLKERNCGEFEGRPRDLIFSSCDIDFIDPEVNSGAFGVEPINDMTARVRSFLEDLKAKYPDDAKILIFTSNGVMLRTHIITTNNPDQERLPEFANSEFYLYEI